MESALNLDTSAGRLAEILARFKTQAPNRPAIEGWVEALDTSTEDLFARIAELTALYQRTISDVLALPEDEAPDFHVEGLEPLKEAFNRFLYIGGNTNEYFQQPLTEVVIQNLRHCSLALKRSGSSDASISDEHLKVLADDVRQWIGIVLDDTALNKHDKALILQRLYALELALVSFFIGGFQNVEGAFAGVLGTGAMIDESARPGFFAKASEIWHKVQNFMTGTKGIAETAEKTAKAIEAVDGLFS